MSNRMLIPLERSGIDFRELKVEFVSATNQNPKKRNNQMPNTNFEPKSKKIKIAPRITIGKIESSYSVKKQSCSCVINSDCVFHTKFMEQTLQFQNETKRLLTEILKYCTSQSGSQPEPVGPVKFARKVKHFPIDTPEKFSEVNELCQKSSHQHHFIKKFSELRGDTAENVTPALMNRSFQALFTDEFLDHLCRSRQTSSFSKSELVRLWQEVWIGQEANEDQAENEFRRQVKYCITLGKNRVYKKGYIQRIKEATPKFEEEYLIDDALNEHSY